MNSTENSTGTPGFAMPRGNMTANVDVARIGRMSGKELWSMQGSIHTLGDVLAAMLCQPKHFHDDTYNAAGEALTAIAEWLTVYEQAVINAAEAMKQRSERDAEYAAWALLSFEAACTDNLATFAVMAAGAVRDVQTAKRAEAGGARNG